MSSVLYLLILIVPWAGILLRGLAWRRRAFAAEDQAQLLREERQRASQAHSDQVRELQEQLRAALTEDQEPTVLAAQVRQAEQRAPFVSGMLFELGQNHSDCKTVSAWLQDVMKAAPPGAKLPPTAKWSPIVEVDRAEFVEMLMRELMAPTKPEPAQGVPHAS